MLRRSTRHGINDGQGGAKTEVGTHDFGASRAEPNAASRTRVVRHANTRECRKREAAVASECTQTKRGGKTWASCLASAKPGKGYFIGLGLGPWRQYTLRKSVSRRGKRGLRREGPVGDRPRRVVCKASGIQGECSE